MILRFQILRCEYCLVSFLLGDSKLNMFGLCVDILKTKQLIDYYSISCSPIP